MVGCVVWRRRERRGEWSKDYMEQRRRDKEKFVFFFCFVLFCFVSHFLTPTPSPPSFSPSSPKDTANYTLKF